MILNSESANIGIFRSDSDCSSISCKVGFDGGGGTDSITSGLYSSQRKSIRFASNFENQSVNFGFVR